MNSNDRLVALAIMYFTHCSGLQVETCSTPSYDERGRGNHIELKVLINKSLFYGNFNYRDFVFLIFTSIHELPPSGEQARIA